MDEADRVVLFGHEFVVDGSVLDPCVYKSELELICSHEGDNEVLAKGGERLLVEGPGIGFSEDMDAILQLLDGSGDTCVLLGCGEQFESPLFDDQTLGAF